MYGCCLSASTSSSSITFLKTGNIISETFVLSPPAPAVDFQHTPVVNPSQINELSVWEMTYECERTHTHIYTLSLSLCPSPSLSLSRSFSPSPCLSLSLWSPCCQFCFCRVLYYTVLHSFSTESNSTEGDPGVSSPSVPALVYVPTHNTHACTHTRTHTRTHTVLTRTLALQLHIHQVFFLQ